jgi:hypothetical protein
MPLEVPDPAVSRFHHDLKLDRNLRTGLVETQ